MVDMFTPGRIGELEIKNRIARSATWEAMADHDGNVTRALVENTRRLAMGEVGLIIMGFTAVSPEGKGMPGMSGLYRDDQVESHARLTRAVHDAGGKVSIQLAHVGAQVSSKLSGGMEPVGPSAVVNPAFNTTPRELSTAEAEGVVQAFADAARRAAQAGYDAIQIHAAHGYLINQFMSPRFNRRKDRYAEPGRFLMEVYHAVREKSDGRPVHAKLNIDDFLEGSVTPETSLPVARELSEAGIDAFEVSSGTPGSGARNPSRTKIESKDKEGYFLDLARKVKEAVHCPVISVGGFRSPEVINAALSRGDADFVSMSRPFIREPYLVKRWKEGDLRPADCISCSRCFGTVRYGEGIQCMMLYRERKKKEEGRADDE